MLINGNELQCLSKADSCDFDKEGYLFVKQKNESLFNHWKTESFVERFVRLKGNLLLIIATKSLNNSIGSDNNSIGSLTDKCLNLIILEEFNIKSIDECDKYYEFVIEFNRNETIRCFHFATISHEERDQWIQTIHLSSFRFLKSLYKNLVEEFNAKSKSNDQTIAESNPHKNNVIDNCPLLSISGHLSLSLKFVPNLIVFVYYKTVENLWNFLGKTEISKSISPRFYRFLALPSRVHRLSKIRLKFCLYSVIETITNTKCLLGESYLTFKQSLSQTKPVFRIDLKSLAKKQSIGLLIIRIFGSKCYYCENQRKSSTVEEYDYRLDDKSNYLFRTNSLPNISESSDYCENMNVFDSNLFVNTICKSFQFSIPRQKSIAFIDEFMSECELSMIIPQIFMNNVMNDEKKLMNCITYSMGEVKTEYQRNQMRALECHLRLVNVLTESLNQISQYQSVNNFRPSTAKSDLFLQFIPINFHLQRCRITGSDTNQSLTHDMFTVGAYCCHYLGFESGGMKSDSFDSNNHSNNILLQKTWNAMKNYFRISSLRDQIKDNLEILIKNAEHLKNVELALDYFRKVDYLCKEIITILSSKTVDECLTFCESVRGTSDTTNGWSTSTFERTVSLEETRKPNPMWDKDMKRHKSLPNEEHEQELEPIDLIHLNIKASLISINSKLINKNSCLSRIDFEASKRKLKNAIDSLYRTSSLCYASCALNLDRNQIELFYSLRLRRAMIFSQALTALVAATLSKLDCNHFIGNAVQTRSVLAQHEVLLSCYAEEQSMLEDMTYAVNQINECVVFVFEVSEQNCLSPRIEGNSFSLKVIFSVKYLAPNLKSIECSVYNILFNIGINEYATLAETIGSVKLQESINKDSFYRLNEYINRFSVEDSSITAKMNALKAEIWSKRAKNIRILQLSQQIVRTIGGLRFTSCKSAKDRTSMAVTLEEARLCAKFFHIECELNEMQWFQSILDTLRSEGTRRENTLKNIGIAKYAFNSLQLLTFPKLLRAPNGTYSSIET